MKIGIDISQIVYGTGVSQYTIGLVESLLKIDKENQYVLFGGSLRQRKVLSEFAEKCPKERCQSIINCLSPEIADLLWNRLHILPVERLIGKIDVFHSSDWTQPPTKAAKVTTIHDLAIFKYPETFPQKIISVQKRRLALVKKNCDLIIAVSESTKKDIVSILGIPGERIRVIYESGNEKIKKTSAKETEEAKKKFGIKGDYLLAISTLEPRKNLQRIIEAHKSLAKEGLKLVLVGKSGWGKSLEIGENTVLTGFVADRDLAALLSGALVYLYPSLYEGFGQSILSAMACGVPVVTSNVSSMPEVAGQAAVLVDPLSAKSIAEGIQEALTNREDLINKGLAQITKFSWEKCARETLRAYESLLG